MRWFLGLFVLLGTLYADITVVASDGKALTSSVSEKASRCDYYFVIDESGKIIEVIENRHKDVRGGASSALVTMLKEKKATHFIASSLGTKLVDALQSSSIHYTVYAGSVESAVKDLVKK
ncbi:MAG: NifB/NifX family molybdenum-iron cluster-binding protein [Campylobacterota bacterium]